MGYSNTPCTSKHLIGKVPLISTALIVSRERERERERDVI